MDDLSSAKQPDNAKGKTWYKMKLWSHNTNVLLQLFTSLQCCLSYISHLVHTTAASSHRQQLGLCSSTDTLTYIIPSTITKFEQRLQLQVPLFVIAYHLTFSALKTPRFLNIMFTFFMVALCNTAGHIYFHPVVCSSFFFLFFPRLISAAADWMSAILPHMVWP